MVRHGLLLSSRVAASCYRVSPNSWTKSNIIISSCCHSDAVDTIRASVCFPRAVALFYLLSGEYLMLPCPDLTAATYAHVNSGGQKWQVPLLAWTLAPITCPASFGLPWWTSVPQIRVYWVLSYSTNTEESGYSETCV